jgi:hypothetical protein
MTAYSRLQPAAVLLAVILTLVGCGDQAMAIDVDRTKTLADLTEAGEEQQWVVVNDGVMGGVSESSLSVTADSMAVFSGVVSLENNGGFASIRTRSRDFGLGGFTGIRIRVKGDGNRYQFRLRVDSNFDGIAYHQDFDTAPDEWTEIELPFERFEAGFRGRSLSHLGPPDPSKIRQIGFLIADKQAGRFSLLIDWIKAYRGPSR